MPTGRQRSWADGVVESAAAAGGDYVGSCRAPDPGDDSDTAAPADTVVAAAEGPRHAGS